MWWGHPGFVFNPFCGIFFVLLIAFIVTRIFFIRRCGGWSRGYGWYDGRQDAEAILRRRLANGDITEEEYQKMKDILSK